jgi:hypothetical protein
MAPGSRIRTSTAESRIRLPQSSMLKCAYPDVHRLSAVTFRYRYALGMGFREIRETFGQEVRSEGQKVGSRRWGAGSKEREDSNLPDLSSGGLQAPDKGGGCVPGQVI